ncbi:glycoside hydrolase 97 [Halalkalicoccus paucihalophilus]|uniref:Glycoside hydrolase 97 n=2 Tax=Halalkalicoccus paucihalophilus TaxID=1008153 RepID=A0A151AAQ2_9EURY|nr:glycoside hydrolase 97 [Halalkalicoccus paucihalophilus]
MEKAGADRDAREITALGRRGFLGGVTGLMAAAAYTVGVPEAVSGQIANDEDDNVQTVASPDGSIEVTVDLADGQPTYTVTFDGTTYVDVSSLGFDFQNQSTFGVAADGSYGAAVTVTGSESGVESERWDPVWDQYDSVAEEFNYLRLGLEETASPNRSVNLELRVFDDGLGFRFAFDDDFAANSDKTVITSENTQFNFADDYTAWWIRNEFVNPRFEQEYKETDLSGVSAGTRSIRPNENTIRNGAHTPFTVKAGEDAYLSVHEADLTDYATMSLAPQSDDGGTDFTAELAPLPDGTKVVTEAPTVTPWRTIQVTQTPGELAESSLIPLLNDELDESVLPTVAGEPDTSWITPRKYVGIWWTMIAGNAQWEYKPDAEIEANGNDPAAYIHGARTERMKRYMSFASQNGIDSVLVEGWNEGWDSYPGSGATMDFDQSYPDFSLAEVTDYGQLLDPAVEMTAHNETGGNLGNYEEQILGDDTFQYYEDNDIRTIKNGYVSDAGLIHESPDNSPTINHHCQIAVNHHELVAREAAGNRQLLERHEADKPTGKRRTYPNLAATETVKAQEFDGFNALASDLGPDHHVELPFTRMLAGPTSFQPGIFDITFNDDTGGQIQTTLAKQLAMYPTYNAGIQMAADRIEAYINPELGVGELVQAAAGNLDGMITADNWRNAFGTNYVAVDPSRVPPGASVSFTVTDVPTDGTYDLHLRYASDAEQNASRVIEAGETRATLRVNDSTDSIELPFTEYWDDWQVFTTAVELTEGENTVAVELHYDDSDGTFTGDVGGFNLNTIAVTEQGDMSPIPSEYADYTPENENFKTEPEFDFLKAIPAGGWDDTSVLDAVIGEYTVTARKSGEEWFVGTMTGERGRALDVPLDFLAPGRGNEHANENGTPANSSNVPRGPKYVAEMYSDGIDASLAGEPTDVRIDEAIVDPSTTLLASAVASGGQAIRLRKARGRERAELLEYERPEQEYDAISLPEQTYVTFPFDVKITGSHTGQFIGGEELNVYADGEQVDTVLVRFSETQETDSFSLTFDEAGEYDITVGRTLEDTLPAQTISIEDPYTAELPEQYSTFASAPAEFGRIDDRLLINAAGEDIETYADEYGTIYVDDGLGESGTVTAEILDQENTDPYAKVGIIVRNDITGASESPGYLLIATSPLLGPFMHVDTDASGRVDQFIGSEVSYSFPTHLRLEKEGTTFTGLASVDGGSTFTEIGTVDVSSAAKVQDAGMFALSHNVGEKSRVAFGDFEITE